MNPEIERLVSRLRTTADTVIDAHPLDLSKESVAIDLRQGANSIEDLAQGAEAAFHSRLHRKLDSAMRSFVADEFGWDAYCQWAEKPDKDGTWPCLITDGPVVMWLAVRVTL